jgi:hypothetical protein
MADTHIVFFQRPPDETPDGFGKRIRDVAAMLAADANATTVVAFVDDGELGAAPEASAYPSTYDGALLVSGIRSDALPAGDAIYGVRRRVVKARPRGRDGARSDGFTVVCPSVRMSHIDHGQFDAHWRDVHSRVHVESSPGTCHYEQLIIDEWLTPSAPHWDGVGLLSFASADDYAERLFGPGGEAAIMADVPNFVDLSKGETLPASEFVYLDETEL